MSALASILEINRPIMFSIYGQVFFLVGLVVLLQSRRHSRLKLAASLWLLAVFGVMHGFSKWAYVFVPIQAEHLPPDVVGVLWVGHALLEALSFAFLFQFGVSLIWPHSVTTSGSRLARLMHLMPSALFTIWLVLFFYVVLDLDLQTAEKGVRGLAAGDAIGRYMLALPGAGLAALGLLRHAQDTEILAGPRIARFLKAAAGCLAVFSVLGGLVVPRGDFFPASFLNYDLFRLDLGVPVHVFRSLCGLALAYFIARALQVFDVEVDRKIEQFERERTLAVERERIGRELHDGTIQSIYAAGLALEDVAITIDRDQGLAKQKANDVMAMLNVAIGDIRKYILDLSPRSQDGEFDAQLDALAHEFADRAGMSVDVQVGSNRRLAAESAHQLLQVAREALANAARHSKAKHLMVGFGEEDGFVILRIRDDGCGMDKSLEADAEAATQGNGLRNIARRMEMIGGSVRVESAPGRGTELTFKVPNRGGHN